MSRGATGRAGQRGMVTVELAIGFVTATVLAAVLVGVLLLGVAQAACARTGSEMARQLARGDGAAAARAQQEAPARARVSTLEEGDGVAVRVSVPVAILGVGEVWVHAASWARYEQGAGQ